MVGWYRDASNAQQAFVEDEVNGTWGSFQPVGGLSRLNTGQIAELNSVSPAASATLTTNTATVQFGQEQLAQLTINVKPGTGGTPAGNVTIKAGSTTIAVVTLKRGRATWTFPPKKLRPGTYQLTGTYASSNGYGPATTAKKKLVVTP